MAYKPSWLKTNINNKDHSWNYEGWASGNNTVKPDLTPPLLPNQARKQLNSRSMTDGIDLKPVNVDEVLKNRKYTVDEFNKLGFIDKIKAGLNAQKTGNFDYAPVNDLYKEEVDKRANSKIGSFESGFLNSASLGTFNVGAKAQTEQTGLPNVFQKAEEQHPYLYKGGEMAGYILPGSMGVKAAKPLTSKLASPLAQRLAEGALVGGGMTAAQDTLEGKSLKDTAIDTGINTVLGAGLDLGLHGLGKGVKKVFKPSIKPVEPLKTEVNINTPNAKAELIPEDIKPVEAPSPTNKLEFTTKGVKVKEPDLNINYEKINDADFLKNHIAELETAITTADEPTKLQMNLQLFAAKERLKKLSKVYSNTLQKTDVLTQAEKELLNPKDFSYDVKTEKASLEEARNRIDADIESEIKSLNKKQVYSGSDVDTMMGILSDKYLKEARQSGDYTEVSKWLKNVRKAGTEGGRTVQSFAKYSRTKEGALIDAQRVVDNVEDAVKKTNPKLIEELDKETKGLKDAVDKAKKEASKEIEKKLPEELLANKVSSTLNQPKESKPDLVNDMVNELFRVAKESPLPEKVARAKRSPLEFLTEAIQNKNQYGDVWNKAKDIIREKYKNDPEALNILEDYFSKGIIPQYSNATVNSSVKVTIKNLGTTLDNIARSAKGDKEQFLAQLTEYISKVTGATGEDASLLVSKIKENYDKLVAEKSQSILKQMFKDVPPKQQKNMFDKVQELINLGAYDDEALRDLIKTKKGLPVLDKADIEFITEHMDKAASYPEGSVQQRGEYSLVEKLISNKQPKTFGEKAKAFRKDMMLFNPVTLITRNPGSNVLLGGAENIKDIPGTLIDKIVSRKTGIRTTGLPEYGVLRKGNLVGAKRGLEEYKYDLKNGTDTARSRGQMEIAKGDTFTNPILKKIDNVVNLGLQLGDRPFFEAAFDGRLNELMKLNKVTEPTEDMIKDAMNIALERVLQNDSKLSGLGGALRKSINDHSINGLGDVILPFTQTPGNVLDKTIDYSPLGLLKAGMTANKLKNFAGSGAKFEASQLQKKMVDQAARGVLGTGLLAGGVLAGKSGLATGKAENNKSLDAFNKAIGKQDYSLKAGNKYISYDWAQPLATPFAAGVDASKEKSLGKGLVSGVDTVFKQSFLRGVANLFGSGSPAMGFYKTMLDVPRSFMPAVGGRISKTIDPYSRDTSDSNSIKATGKSMLAQTPFSSMLPAKVDVNGKKIENFNGNRNPLNTMLSPAYTSKYNPTKTDDMLLDVFSKTSDTEILPKVVDDAITYTDKQGKQQTLKLNSAEKQALQEKVGQETRKQFDAVANNYNGNAEQTAKILKTIKGNVWNKARTEILKEKKVSYK